MMGREPLHTIPPGRRKEEGRGNLWVPRGNDAFFETAGTQLETGILSAYLQQWYLWPGVNQPVAIWENVGNCISDMLCI